MSDGMSDYWRNKRAKDHHDRVVRDFIVFMNCILENKPAPYKMLKDMDQIVQQLYESMKLR